MDGFIFVQNKSTDGDPRPKKKKQRLGGGSEKSVSDFPFCLHVSELTSPESPINVSIGDYRGILTRDDLIFK